MATDLLNRRLRFSPPSPLVRRLVPTEADYLLFEAINRHGPLPTHYLHEFTKHLRRDYTHLQNRLTEFYNGDAHGAWLTRPQQQFAGFEARYQHVVYDLAPRAKIALAERGTLARFSPRRTDPFLHQLMQACVASSLELSAIAKGLRYIRREEIFSSPKCPKSTREMQNPLAIPIEGSGQKTLIPDDLFGIEYLGVGFRFFALEIDRNTESIKRKNVRQTAFGTKIVGYLGILRSQTYRTHWGIPNLHILTVTTNATHARNILHQIEKQVDKGCGDRFAFACEPSFGANWRVPKRVLSKLLGEPLITAQGMKEIARS
ncbi:MAG: replication-relaxation family protein [Sphingomonas bacterium]